MKGKKLLIFCLIFIAGLSNIYAFGLKGGYSLVSGIELGAAFGETDRSGGIVGVAFPVNFKSVCLFGEYYYDFIFLDTGSFNMGLELGAGGLFGISSASIKAEGNTESGIGLICAGYPMIGFKFGFIDNKLDIYALYEPVAGNIDAYSESYVAEGLLVNWLNFAAGVRYHFN